MLVTQHARERIESRAGGKSASVIATLEAIAGVPGVQAYILLTVPRFRAPDGSNGDTLVALARDGSVETVMLRRSSQDLTAGFFGADDVHDLRGTAYDDPLATLTRSA